MYKLQEKCRTRILAKDRAGSNNQSGADETTEKKKMCRRFHEHREMVKEEERKWGGVEVTSVSDEVTPPQAPWLCFFSVYQRRPSLKESFLPIGPSHEFPVATHNK